MTGRDELRIALADLYLSASSAVVGRLDEAGVSYTVEVVRTVIDRASATQWSAQRRAETCNVLTLDHPALPAAPWLGESEISAAVACSVVLADLASETLPFWVPFPGPAGPLVETGLGGPMFEQDRAGWAARVLILPALRHHLAALPSVDQANESAAAAFADDVLSVATARDLRYLVSLALSGLDLDPAGALTVDNVTIRPLTDLEQGAILDQRGGAVSLTSNFTELPSTVLELRVTGPRNEQLLRSDEQVEPLVAAFQLHGYHLAGHRVATRAEPPWVLGGVSHRPLVLPRRPRASAMLTADGLQSITGTARRLEPYNISGPASPHDLALHRFVAGLARDTHADGVLDFTIALEALLLPYDENARRGDLGYRFRVHGAHDLSRHADQRQRIAKQLSGIYEMRSRLVHGGRYPDRTQVRDAHEAAYDLARRGLLRAVHEGFPTATTFNEMVLGLPPGCRAAAPAPPLDTRSN